MYFLTISYINWQFLNILFSYPCDQHLLSIYDIQSAMLTSIQYIWRVHSFLQESQTCKPMFLIPRDKYNYRNINKSLSGQRKKQWTMPKKVSSGFFRWLFFLPSIYKQKRISHLKFYINFHFFLKSTAISYPHVHTIFVCINKETLKKFPTLRDSVIVKHLILYIWTRKGHDKIRTGCDYTRYSNFV